MTATVNSSRLLGRISDRPCVVLSGFVGPCACACRNTGFRDRERGCRPTRCQVPRVIGRPLDSPCNLRVTSASGIIELQIIRAASKGFADTLKISNTSPILQYHILSIIQIPNLTIYYYQPPILPPITLQPPNLWPLSTNCNAIL
jgi:hypothetical protein